MCGGDSFLAKGLCNNSSLSTREDGFSGGLLAGNTTDSECRIMQQLQSHTHRTWKSPLSTLVVGWDTVKYSSWWHKCCHHSSLHREWRREEEANDELARFQGIGCSIYTVLWTCTRHIRTYIPSTASCIKSRQFNTVGCVYYVSITHNSSWRKQI